MNVSIKGELEDEIKTISKRLYLTPRQFVMQALERELGKKKGELEQDEIRVNGLNERNRRSTELGTGF